jgi:hypothetical protein
MKYKLVNTHTKEEHLCDKVTIEGFDYYTEDGNIVKPIDFSKYQYQKGNGIFRGMDNMKQGEVYEIIACNNPNIEIPKVVDEVEKLFPTNRKGSMWVPNADKVNNQYRQEGYNKSQETHPFSEEDIRSFATHFYTRRLQGIEETIDNSLQLWKEQQPKTIYYS